MSFWDNVQKFFKGFSEVLYNIIVITYEPPVEPPKPVEPPVELTDEESREQNDNTKKDTDGTNDADGYVPPYDNYLHSEVHYDGVTADGYLFS